MTRTIYRRARLLGLSYYGAKRFPEAVKQLQIASQAQPDNAELHHVLAQSCLWAKQYDCAQEQFRQILQQEPDSAAAHVLLGEALDGLERTPEAITEFQTAIQSAPREPDLHFGLGYLYWKSQRYPEAQKEFQAELGLDPKHAQSLAYLGDIAIKQNDPQRAIDFLRQAISLKQDIRIAYLDLGAAQAQLKNYPEAVKALNRAVELDPNQSDAHYRLANVYKSMGNASAAQAEFAKVRKLQQGPEEDLVHKMSSSPPSLKGP